MEARFNADYKKEETEKKAETQRIKTTTQVATTTTATDVAKNKSNEKNLKDIDYKIEYDGTNIKKESMVAMLADFDSTSGVEVSNRSILRQALFGGGKQKEVVGEAQVYELLSRKNPKELDAIYTRLTGDDSGLPWTAKSFREGKTIYDLDWDAQKKITRFQRELADQSSMMADISEALLGK